MGNRAYLRIFMSESHYSKDFINYQSTVDDFYSRLKYFSATEKASIENKLSKVAEVIYPGNNFHFCLPSMFSFKLKNRIYYSNYHSSGEYCNSCWEEKNFVPKNWCEIFRRRDKIKGKKVKDNDNEYMYKPHNYRTTVKKALKRLKRSNTSTEKLRLIKWLERYPLDAFVVLEYRELLIDDNFSEEDVVKMIRW